MIPSNPDGVMACFLFSLGSYSIFRAEHYVAIESQGKFVLAAPSGRSPYSRQIKTAQIGRGKWMGALPTRKYMTLKLAVLKLSRTCHAGNRVIIMLLQAPRVPMYQARSVHS